MLRARIALSILLILVSGTAHADTEITGCGQILTDHGFLSGDLDCSGFADYAITTAKPNRRIDFRGFTLTTGCAGIRCLRGCRLESMAATRGTLLGPGSCPDDPAVRGGVEAMTNVEKQGKVLMSNIDIDGYFNGVRAKKVRADNVEIRNNTSDGLFVEATAGARLRSVVIDGNGGNGFNAGFGCEDGICRRRCFGSLLSGKNRCGNLKIESSTITNNGGSGLDVGKVKIYGSLISGNGGDGVLARGKGKLQISDSLVEGNGGDGLLGLVAGSTGGASVIRAVGTTIRANAGRGIANEQVQLIESLVELNGSHGVEGGRSSLYELSWRNNVVGSQVVDNGGYGILVRYASLLVSASTVTGNVTSGTCEVEQSPAIAACADLAKNESFEHALIFENGSVCGTSHVYGSGDPGENYGICTDDL